MVCTNVWLPHDSSARLAPQAGTLHTHIAAQQANKPTCVQVGRSPEPELASPLCAAQGLWLAAWGALLPAGAGLGWGAAAAAAAAASLASVAGLAAWLREPAAMPCRMSCSTSGAGAALLGPGLRPMSRRLWKTTVSVASWGCRLAAAAAPAGPWPLGMACGRSQAVRVGWSSPLLPLLLLGAGGSCLPLAWG